MVHDGFIGGDRSRTGLKNQGATTLLLSSFRAERVGDPEPSGAEGDLFTQGVRDSFALSRAAGFRVSEPLRASSPGMTIAEGGAPL